MLDGLKSCSFYEFRHIMNNFSIEGYKPQYKNYYHYIKKSIGKDISNSNLSILNVFVNEAIKYWNSLDTNAKTKIDIDSNQLVKLIYQYESLNLRLLYSDIERLTDEELDKISYIIYHPVTNFILYIILFYLFKNRYKEQIDHLKNHSRIDDDRIIVSVLYNLLLKRYKILDFSLGMEYTK